MKCDSRRDESQQDEARRGPGQRGPIKEVVTTDTFRLRSRLTALDVECQGSNGLLLLARSTCAWLLALCRHHLLHVPLRIELLVRRIWVLCRGAGRGLCGCSLLWQSRHLEGWHLRGRLLLLLGLVLPVACHSGLLLLL